MNAEKIKEIIYMLTVHKDALSERRDNETKTEFIKLCEEQGIKVTGLDEFSIGRMMLDLIKELNDVEYTKSMIEDYKRYGLGQFDILDFVKIIGDEEYTKTIIENYQKYEIDKKVIIKFLEKTNYLECKKFIIENYQSYGLNLDDIYSLILSVNDTEYLKDIIKDFKRYEIDTRGLIYLVKKINDKEYTKSIIENYQKYGLSEDWISDLLIDLNDEEYTKTVIENYPKYGFSGEYIKDLVIKLNNKEYTKIIIEDYQKYGLTKKDVANLVITIKDAEYAKNIIKNYQKYGLSNREIEWIVVRAIKDAEYTKNMLENYRKYGLTEYEVAQLVESIKDVEYIKNIVANYQKYGLTGGWVTELVKSVHDKEYIKSIIKDHQKYSLDGYCISKLVKEINNEAYTKEIIENYTEYDIDEQDVITFLTELKHQEIMPILKKINSASITQEYRINYASIEYIEENFDDFLQIESENDPEQIKFISQMYSKNKDILKTNFRIFDKKFLNIFGEEKIAQIACYPRIANEILGLNKKQLKIIEMCLESHMKNSNSEEWTPLADKILANISTYDELLNNIDEINVNDITQILINPNEFNLKTKEDIENYQEIKRMELKKLIKSKSIGDKREGTLLKIFNITLSDAKELVRKFGKDIDSIDDDELRIYIKSLNEILETQDAKILENIYNNVEEVKETNQIVIERKLKNEYGKLYNAGLFKVNEAEKIPGYENMYDAGTDFKMIITSVAAYCRNQPKNYKEDWNRSSMFSQHFCASYIRNDMMGHAPIPHICYGFSEMSDDALMLSGCKDLSSSYKSSFVSKASWREEYYSPDRQINETEKHNEMDFRRIQNGENKQPDYIVVFQRDGKIDNLEKAQKASKEFGDLPIVVIDVDECLEAEEDKVDELLEQYEDSHSPEIAEKIYYKVKNNRITESDFYPDVDLEEMKEAMESQESFKISKDDFKRMYEKSSSQERNIVSQKLKSIYMKIKSIVSKNKDEKKGFYEK